MTKGKLPEIPEIPKSKWSDYLKLAEQVNQRESAANAVGENRVLTGKKLLELAQKKIQQNVR